jgi:hypothetical protein
MNSIVAVRGSCENLVIGDRQRENKMRMIASGHLKVMVMSEPTSNFVYAVVAE